MHAYSLTCTRVIYPLRVHGYINILYAGPLHHSVIQQPSPSSHRRQVYKTSQDTRPSCWAEQHSETLHTEPIRGVLHHSRCCYWFIVYPAEFLAPDLNSERCGGWRYLCHVSLTSSSLLHDLSQTNGWEIQLKRVQSLYINTKNRTTSKDKIRHITVIPVFFMAFGARTVL